MKNFIEKSKNKVCSVCKKVTTFVTAGIVAMNTIVMAAPTTPDIWEVVGGIIDVVGLIALIVGLVYLAIGFFNFAMAQRQEDVERKNQAVHQLTAGILLCCFKAVFSGIFALFGITL